MPSSGRLALGVWPRYLAEDLKHHREVAVKVLRPDLAAVLGAERFLKEIEVTANLQHPHILPLHDSGDADGFLFYVMPYVEGESLREKVDQERQHPVDEAVRIAVNVAEASTPFSRQIQQDRAFHRAQRASAEHAELGHAEWSTSALPYSAF